VKNSTTFSESETSALLEVYCAAATSHYEGTTSGNHIKANDAARILASVIGEIINRDYESQHLFLQLLESESSQVRMWAATHALNIDEGIATKVLEETAANPTSFYQHDAELVLTEWRAGMLRISLPDRGDMPSS
jgi:hypothetical protein